MMKYFILLAKIIVLLKACSVTRDFKFSTMEEEIDFAGGIVTGRVKNVSNQFDALVVLESLTFYRGCVG